MERVSFAELVEQLSDGVYLMDRNRRIAFWNRAAEEITGFTREEVVGRHCANNILMHVDEQGRCLCRGQCPAATTMKEGIRHESEIFLHHKDGHRIPVWVKTSPIFDADGRVIGATEVFGDLSPKLHLAAKVAELEHLAMLDPLTELPNRRHLEGLLEARAHELDRFGWPFGVLMIDVDYFKLVNDTFGHPVGDRVLRMTARTLGSCVRAFDVVGRWGGEEFLALISRSSAEETTRIAERLRAMVAGSQLEVDGKIVKVTVSVGAACANRDHPASDVLVRADAKLYEAKSSGRNKVVC
ncbi:MAG: diguanylate cyclase [Deltaproteobacteria bacterium RIFOXYA12_FULL_58_15]|nr:MAG: diguanylate cyclase [Deltaproteobacteria bacterium RIFOXYA12_FULL_58_15]OGR13463.1 MAG: diguanylate cyclase [Deltaproteobacteria bacterium RIFOXYB12_FULL_58_9]